MTMGTGTLLEATVRFHPRDIGGPVCHPVHPQDLPGRGFVGVSQITLHAHAWWGAGRREWGGSSRTPRFSQLPAGARRALIVCRSAANSAFPPSLLWPDVVISQPHQAGPAWGLAFACQS